MARDPYSKAARGIRSNQRVYDLQRNVGGVAQNMPEQFVPATNAVDIANMHSPEEGRWTSHNIGYTVVNSGGTAFESGAQVNGITTFTDSNGLNKLYIAINQKLKIVDLATGLSSNADASAGYSLTGQVDFQKLGDYLFSCDGTIATPRRWDGASGTASGGWPVNDGGTLYDTPKYVEEHQGRLAYAVGSHVIISNFEDGETFTLPALEADDAFVGQVGHGDNSDIVGMRSMNIPLTNDEVLVVVKEDSTHAIIGNSGLAGDADEFRRILINGSYGAFNNRCIVRVGNDLLMLSRDGVYSYVTSREGGTVQPVAIGSRSVKDVFRRMNVSATRTQGWGIHLPHLAEVWFGICCDGSSQVNEYIVYKYPEVQGEVPKWFRRTDASSKFKMSCGVLKDRDFYVASYGGKVGEMFTASTYDGTGIPWTFEHGIFYGSNKKQIKFLACGDAEFLVREDQTVTCVTEWRGGNNNYRHTGTVNLSTAIGGALYSVAIFGTDVYGEAQELSGRFRAPGNGYGLKRTFTGTNGENGVDFMGEKLTFNHGTIFQGK